MTRIFEILVMAVMLVTATGCSDWLELKPEDEIVLEDFWKDETQVKQALAGCYSSMTESGFMEKVLVWGEIRSDNVSKGDGIGDDMSNIIEANLSPSSGLCSWAAFYRTINYCNTFLHYAPKVVDLDPNFNESELHSLEAEALTIRALCYFYLVRTFQEVPWVEEASIDDSQNFKIAKSPEEFVLGKLVEDLQTAYKYARTKFDDPVENKGRITRNAVSSLLADIYLWQGEFAKCIDACDQVINDTEQGLKLVKGENVLLKVFGEGNSSESIFELQFDDDKNVNSIVRNYYGYLGDISGEWSFSPVLVTGLASPFNFQTTAGIESEEDIRLKDYLFPSIDKYYIFKYAGVSRDEFTSSISRYNYKSVTSNWIFYRLSDIMLMKAEALIELETDFNEALRLINITYMRSNAETPSGELQLTTYNSKYDMEKLVYRERQRELMFEGKRWFDLMRLARRANSTAPLLGYVMKKYSGTASAQAAKMAVMNALYWPILSSELDVNPELKQNPFYELEGESSH